MIIVTTEEIFLLSYSRDSVTAVINWYAYKSVHVGTQNFNSNQFGAAFRINSLIYCKEEVVYYFRIEQHFLVQLGILKLQNAEKP